MATPEQQTLPTVRVEEHPAGAELSVAGVTTTHSGVARTFPRPVPDADRRFEEDLAEGVVAQPGATAYGGACSPPPT